MAVVALVVPVVALFRDILGWKASVGLIAASWAGIYLLLARLAATALGGLARIAEALEQAGGVAVDEAVEELAGIPYREDEGLEGVDDPEGELFVWALARSLYKGMGGGEDVVLVVVDEGIPVTAYPPEAYMEVDSEEVEAQEPPRAERDPEAGMVVVTLSPNQFLQLSRAAKTGEGESLVVEDYGTLKTLYSLAKALAEAITGPGPLASYVAYKAILKAHERGYIRFNPEGLLDKLPLEDSHTRRRVREQVSEELSLHNSGKGKAGKAG
ncbi:hypothetical protein [Stetteria hydrogenophila]